MILPNLNHLKYFLDAVDCGSISQSADKNLVTHPAISRAIQSLENQLDVKLLNHRRKSFEVTKEGLILAERARQLLDSAKHFQAHDLSMQPSGSVTLALSRSLAQAYLPSILAYAQKKYPKIKLQVQFGTTAEIVKKVTESSADIGLSIGEQKMPNLKQTLLKKGKFILISSSTKKIDLTSAPFILTEPRFETELFKKEYYRKYGKAPSLKHEIGSWDMIAQLAAKGHGVGLVPDLIKMPGLSQIKADWFDGPFAIYMHQLKTSQNSSAHQAITEAIAKMIRRV